VSVRRLTHPCTRSNQTTSTLLSIVQVVDSSNPIRSRLLRLSLFALTATTTVAWLVVSSDINPNGNAVAMAVNPRDQLPNLITPSPAIHVRLKGTLTGHAKRIIELAFSPDGENIATGSEDGIVRVWNARGGELQATLICVGKYHWAMNIVWSPDGQMIAIDGGYGGKGLEIWDVRTVKLKVVLATRKLTAVDWSPDSKTVLTTTIWDHVGKLWDVETGSQLATFDQDPACPSKGFWKDLYNNRADDPDCQKPLHLSARFGDGTVITASDVHPAKVWDPSTGKLKKIVALRGEGSGEKWYLNDIVLSPDRRLVAGYFDKEVALLDTATGEVKHSLGKIGVPMAFSPDSKMLLTTIREPTNRTMGDWDQFKLYDIATGQLRLTFERSDLTLYRRDLQWSADGRTIIVARGGAQLLDARTGRVKGSISYRACTPESFFGDDGCQPFILSADGRMAAKVTNPIRLWSDNGTLLTTLDNAHAPAEFNPTDPHCLITRSRDKKSALLWEVIVD